eukprot:scaffold36871_cov49-Phaeocystis_antarctica.AAC.2
MSVTLDVSKLSGWLNADAACRVERRAARMRCGKRCGPGGVGWRRRNWHAQGGPDSRLGGGQGTRRAHVEHLLHVRDLGCVPIGNVRVKVLQVIEELAHVGDGRDVPVGDGAVHCNIYRGSRVGVVRLDRCLQGALGRECGQAGPRTPARAIASGGEGRGARPRATDEQLVGVGQGVCALPSRREGIRCGRRCGREAAGDRGARSVRGRARM